MSTSLMDLSRREQEKWTRENVPCRECRSPAGFRCLTKMGNRAKVNHAIRWGDAVVRYPRERLP